MVDGIGGGSNPARAAIEAALKRHSDAVDRATVHLGAPRDTEKVSSSEFSSAITQSIKDVDAQVRNADRLVDGLVTGEVKNFHEVAAALKQSEIALKFSLEVRNKFIDAYREIMRMSV